MKSVVLWFLGRTRWALLCPSACCFGAMCRAQIHSNPRFPFHRRNHNKCMEIDALSMILVFPRFHSTPEIMKNLEIYAFSMSLGFPRPPRHRRNHKKSWEIIALLMILACPRPIPPRRLWGMHGNCVYWNRNASFSHQPKMSTSQSQTHEQKLNKDAILILSFFKLWFNI